MLVVVVVVTTVSGTVMPGKSVRTVVSAAPASPAADTESPAAVPVLAGTETARARQRRVCGAWLGHRQPSRSPFLSLTLSHRAPANQPASQHRLTAIFSPGTLTLLLPSSVLYVCINVHLLRAGLAHPHPSGAPTYPGGMRVRPPASIRPTCRPSAAVLLWVCCLPTLPD